MKKNKLVIFPHNFVPNIGGLETHIDELTKYLSKNKNIEITVFTPNTSKVKETETIHNNVNVIRYPAFFIIPNYPFPNIFHYKFYKFTLGLYKKDFNLVMTRGRFSYNSLLGLKFAKIRLKPIKLIHGEHGSSHIKVESKITTKLAYLYDKTFGKLLIRMSDSLIAVSKVSKEFVEKEFKPKVKVEVITRGIDFDFYNLEDNLKLKNKFKGKVVIGTLCRLYKWKGIENVVKAYKKLPEEIKKDTVYLIVGGGEDYLRLKKLIGNDLNKNIFLIGQVNQKEAVKYFDLFDLFIHASYPGGALSNSLLQAMYMKCGIVASPNEGANEVIDSSRGILLKDNSIQELTKGIELYLRNKKLIEKNSNEAKRYILKNFSWEDRVKTYERVLRLNTDK